MVESLTDLIERLADVMARETLLLEALELPKAGLLVGEKLLALRALQTAFVAAAPSREKARPVGGDDGLRNAVALLERLSDANRTAIERSLALQMRLIQTIVQAVPRARAAHAPVYQQDGSQLPPRPPEAFAFLSQM